MKENIFERVGRNETMFDLANVFSSFVTESRRYCLYWIKELGSSNHEERDNIRA